MRQLYHTVFSLLLFALFLSLLFLAALHDVGVVGPHLVHHVFVVLFLRDFLRGWQKLHDFLVFIAMSPIGSRVSELIPGVHVDVLHQEHLHQVRMALSRRNMQACETLLIFEVRITTAI